MRVFVVLAMVLFASPAFAFNHCFRDSPCLGAPPTPTAQFPTFTTLLDVDSHGSLSHCASEWTIPYESSKISWADTVTRRTNADTSFSTGISQPYPGNIDCPDCDRERVFRYFDTAPTNSLLIPIEADHELRIFWTWLDPSQTEVITFTGGFGEHWFWNGFTCAPSGNLVPLNALQFTAVPEPAFAAGIMPLLLLLALLFNTQANAKDDEPDCVTADINCDGVVDDVDPVEFAIGWHAGYLPVADLDGDGDCDEADLEVYAESFNEETP